MDKLLNFLLTNTEQTVKSTLELYLKKKYKKVIITDKYIMALGEIPVGLVAHLDTVASEPPQTLLYNDKTDSIYTTGILGADDRAGVFAIIKIIQCGLLPTVIFTTGEEIGGIGAKQLIVDYPKPPVPLNYLIQLDRCGKNDCVFYDCDNQPFISYISTFGFKENFGTFSDISFLCPRWGIAGVNLSIGYQNEHSPSESLRIGYLMETIKRVKEILSQPVIPKFKYIKAKMEMLLSINDFELCEECFDLFSSKDLIPVKTINRSTKHFCIDCAMKIELDWCNICGEAFESIDSEHICYDCRS